VLEWYDRQTDSLTKTANRTVLCWNGMTDRQPDKDCKQDHSVLEWYDRQPDKDCKQDRSVLEWYDRQTA